MHEAAKEMVQVAEQGYMQREEVSDSAWQEMLNHATMKVTVKDCLQNREGGHSHFCEGLHFNPFQDLFV